MKIDVVYEVLLPENGYMHPMVISQAVLNLRKYHFVNIFLYFCLKTNN